MALNLEGFSTPEKSYGQLYNLGEAAERRDYRKSQLDEQRRAKRAANASMLTNLLDPKQHLSGSMYDPVISRSLQDMLAEGAQLADEGADANMILMALGPKVARVSEYAQKAKLLKKEKDEFEQQIKPIKGIDKQKALNAYDEMAYFQADPKTGEKKMKDVSDIDIQTKYADQVLRDGDVYNNEGLADFVKTAGKETRQGDFKYYNEKGSLTQSKGAYTAPPFMVSEKDARGAHIGFVPQYEIVTDNGIPKELEFHTKEGKQTAPVRMVTDAVFNSIPDNGKAYIRQEVRKYAKEHGVELSSPQAYNFAKAIAYDEIKENGKLSSFVSETPEYTRPSTFEIKANLGIPYYKPSSGGGSGVQTVDYFQPIIDWVGSVKEGHGAALTNLPTGSQSIVLKQARDITGKSYLGQKDIYVKKEGGQVVIKDAKTQKIIAPLDFGGINLPANTTLGQKSKQVVAQEAQDKKPKSLETSAKGGKMVTIELNGKTGQVPEGKVAEFLKKYPNAKRK